MAQGLQVVPPALLLAQVSIDGHVTGGTRQTLVLPAKTQDMRNMYASDESKILPSRQVLKTFSSLVPDCLLSCHDIIVGFMSRHVIAIKRFYGPLCQHCQLDSKCSII